MASKSLQHRNAVRSLHYSQLGSCLQLAVKKKNVLKPPPREFKNQTLPIGSGESFICIILKAVLCLVLDFQGPNNPYIPIGNRIQYTAEKPGSRSPLTCCSNMGDKTLRMLGAKNKIQRDLTNRLFKNDWPIENLLSFQVCHL